MVNLSINNTKNKWYSNSYVQSAAIFNIFYSYECRPNVTG